MRCNNNRNNGDTIERTTKEKEIENVNTNKEFPKDPIMQEMLKPLIEASFGNINTVQNVTHSPLDAREPMKRGQGGINWKR